MQAVIAGRCRRQGGGRSPGRYIYTGSLNAVGECSIWRCCGIVCFGAASLSALCGIMLTVFGSTGFFRTSEQNYALLIVGIVLLVTALLLGAMGFVFSRRAQSPRLSLTSRIPSRDNAG